VSRTALSLLRHRLSTKQLNDSTHPGTYFHTLARLLSVPLLRPQGPNIRWDPLRAGGFGIFVAPCRTQSPVNAVIFQWLHGMAESDAEHATDAEAAQA
jgi:hypothetical protein